LINTKWNFNFQSFESELTTTGQNFAGGKYAIYVWSIQTGNILEILTGHTSFVQTLHFSPSANHPGQLVSGSWDGSLKLGHGKDGGWHL
jgi:WD40 repeat protein